MTADEIKAEIRAAWKAAAAYYNALPTNMDPALFAEALHHRANQVEAFRALGLKVGAIAADEKPYDADRLPPKVSNGP